MRDEFYSCVILPGTHSVGGLVGPTAHHLDALETRKLLSTPGIGPQFPGCQTHSFVTIECAVPTSGCKSKICRCFIKTLVMFIDPSFIPLHACTVEQKSIGLIFYTSRSGSDMRYSCHHNSSRFAFPIIAHSWRFSVFHSL